MSQPPGGRERLISRAFVALADTLVDDYDVIDLLDRLVGYSVALLDADAAGIMLADTRRQLHAVAASSEDAALMELLQLQAEQGPCVECFHSAAPVSAPDLTEATTRWPRFVAAARAWGAFASVHALPLRLRGQAIGALNLLHRTPGSLPEDDLALGQTLADIATIGILQERAIRRTEVVNEQLQTALRSRVIIEQAKGVLAQHSGLAMDEAFNQLRGYVRAHNLRLADVAGQIATGQLDPNALSRRRGSAGGNRRA
jgi:transcriptional regulator with GAF, ATPase, and Fis domain